MLTCTHSIFVGGCVWAANEWAGEGQHTLRWGRPEAEGDLARLRPMAALSEVRDPELCLPRERAATVLGGSACGMGRSPELRLLTGAGSPDASLMARTRFTPQALHRVLGPVRTMRLFRLSRIISLSDTKPARGGFLDATSVLGCPACFVAATGQSWPNSVRLRADVKKIPINPYGRYSLKAYLQGPPSTEGSLLCHTVCRP